ncbi:MAG TPA: molybdenum cofactor biosynthesis protein MoaE [Longimicrobiales bacterium]
MAEVRAWITDEAISAESVRRLVAADEHGATLVFLGTVRDHNEGRAVRGVHYEAYREMAEQVLRAIVAEAAERNHPANIAAVHRLGELSIGDVSIAIAVATPHRAEAFDACRYIIEEVKKRLSVWKQERYASGEKSWLDGAVPPVPEARS